MLICVHVCACARVCMYESEQCIPSIPSLALTSFARLCKHLRHVCKQQYIFHIKAKQTIVCSNRKNAHTIHPNWHTTRYICTAEHSTRTTITIESKVPEAWLLPQLNCLQSVYGKSTYEQCTEVCTRCRDVHEKVYESVQRCVHSVHMKKCTYVDAWSVHEWMWHTYKCTHLLCMKSSAVSACLPALSSTPTEIRKEREGGVSRPKARDTEPTDLTVSSAAVKSLKEIHVVHPPLPLKHLYVRTNTYTIHTHKYTQHAHSSYHYCVALFAPRAGGRWHSCASEAWLLHSHLERILKLDA